MPPRQRAALILRDVLGFPASEAARILKVTEESLTSALKRARANLREDMPVRPRSRPTDRAVEKDLAERLTEAYRAGDVTAIIALFSDDAWLTMPPFPLEYQGRELIGSFLAAVAFRDRRTYRLIETRANGQLAFGAFLTEPRPGDEDANGLIALAVGDGKIRAMTRFPATVLPRFSLGRLRQEGWRTSSMQPADQGLDPAQRPPLVIGEPVRQRPQRRSATSRARRCGLSRSRHTGPLDFSASAPPSAQAHRHRRTEAADPQVPRNLPGAVPGGEPPGCLKL